MPLLNVKPLSKTALAEVRNLCVVATRQDLCAFDWSSLDPATARSIHALLPFTVAKALASKKASSPAERYFVGSARKRPVNALRFYTHDEAAAHMDNAMKADDRDLYVWSVSESKDPMVLAA